MQVLSRFYVAALVAVMALLGAGAAWAGIGQPYRLAARPAGGRRRRWLDDIIWFHNILLGIITVITIFVLALLVYVVMRFNARANPTPSRTTHNTLIEVVWTLVPVLILLVIAITSFKSLFFQLNMPKADLTVKATGKQWFWSYTYPDSKFEFDSIMLSEKERKAKLDKDPKADVPRLLSVDNELVVPVNKVVRVQTTGADVIHAFAVPSFGIKIDAIPGRLNETWFKADARRRLLRPVLGAVRQGSRLHADRGAGGERAGLHGLARGGEEEIRERRKRRPPSTVAAGQ